MVLTVHHLMGPREIAEFLGVSRQRVSQLMVKPGFPAPAADLAQGKVWHTEDVEKWQAERKAQGRA